MRKAKKEVRVDEIMETQKRMGEEGEHSRSVSSDLLLKPSTYGELSLG